LNVLVYIAPGFEEIEAITVIDVLRRAGLNVICIAVHDKKLVTGAHGITISCEQKLSTAAVDAAAIVLPGGMPGSRNLAASEQVLKSIKKYAAQGKIIAAICAAPTVLAEAGVLSGKKACCYPGFEDQLGGAEISFQEKVVIDGHIITSQGVGTALEFALCLVGTICGEELRLELSRSLLCPAA
jgi:4-methyl-5(b-hydroxyethyl)-thiazole monophosphate biosynthesis